MVFYYLSMKIFNEIKNNSKFKGFLISTRFIRSLSLLLVFYILSSAFQIHSKTRGSCKDFFVIDTEYGKVTLRLLKDVAPRHVEQIKKLSSQGFYNNGCYFKRVIKDSFAEIDCDGKDIEKIQSVKAEFSSKYTHKRGVVSMSRGADINSGKFKFFITTSDSPHLDKSYTIFGYVTDGMEIIDGLKPTNKTKRKENFIHDIKSLCDVSFPKRIDLNEGNE